MTDPRIEPDSEGVRVNLTPPADRVLIRQCEPEAETAFGLVIPDNVAEKPMRGIVVAVGEGLPDPLRPGVRIPLGIYRTEGIEDYDEHGRFAGDAPPLGQLWPGDEVVLPRYGGTEIDYDGETLVSILASEILGVLV